MTVLKIIDQSMNFFHRVVTKMTSKELELLEKNQRNVNFTVLLGFFELT